MGVKFNIARKNNYINISICIIIAISLLIFTVKNAITERNREITILTHETKVTVSSITAIYTHHLELLKSRAEELFSENLSENKIDKNRLINVKGEGWELLPNEKDTLTLIGRITGTGSVAELSKEKIQEIFFTEKLNKYFARTKHNLPNAPFVYYVSKENFWNAIPRHSAETIFFIDEYLNYDFYQLGLPEKNNNRNVFWSKPYLDASGAGLMVTAAIPIYHKNEFKGTICIDMLFTEISNYLKSNTFAYHHISVIDNYKQVVSSTFQDLTNHNNIPTLQQLLNDDKTTNQNFKEYKFIWHGGKRIFTSAIPNTQWHVIHFETRREFLTAITLKVLPVFTALIFFLIIIYLLLYTNRLRIENERAKNNAEEAILIKNKFISILAHDLRGAFFPILSFSKLLKNNIDTYSQKDITEFVNLIYETANNTYSLLESLLEWAKSQQENTEFMPKNIQLLSFKETSKNMFSDIAKSKNVDIAYSIPDEIVVYADLNMVNTIFRNLINNAIKFTPNSGQVRLSATKRQKMVEIVVSDTGVGMDTDTIQSLFKIGVTISKEGTDGEVGTGFGLLLCKEFVEKNGGKIWVESELGKGSHFKFTLPLSNE